MGKRRIFTPSFKFEVALDLVSGRKSNAALCREHQLARPHLAAGRISMLTDHPVEARRALAEMMPDELCADEVGSWVFGVDLSATGNYQAAVDQWACGPHIPRKYLNEGDQLFTQGDLAGSATAYQSAVDVAANQRNLRSESAGYIGLVRVARAQKRWDQVIVYSRQAMDLTPDDASAVAFLAHTLSMAGQTAEARFVANRSLALQPNSSQSRAG